MNNIRKQYLVTLTLAMFSASVSAHTLDLTLNNKAVGLDYSTQVTEAGLNVGGGLLHHEDNGDAYYGSLFVADNVNEQSNLLAGIGARFYYLDEDEGDLSGTAVGIGGFINWEIPAVPNVSLRTDIYYAPDVLAFDDISRYLDFTVKIQYRIIEQAWLYIGYRNAEMESASNGNDFEIDEGGHLGIMLWF